MAKILKHFGLGTKKSNTSPAHKCKLETDSPKVPRSSADKKKETKEDGSNSSSSPLSPVKSPFDYSSGEPSAICDFKQNSKGLDKAKQVYKEVVNDDDVPVYSAVIKDKITPDSILNEITLKLNVSEEKSNTESLSTFGKSSIKNGEAGCEKKAPTNEKLPDVIKADTSSSSGGGAGEHALIEYDDPYEEGPIMRPSDSGMSSLKSSTTTLNHCKNNEDGDTLERTRGGGDGAGGSDKCVGETQIGFDTLRSWNMEADMIKSSTTETNHDTDTNSDNDTLEGSAPPPPIPAKTYNINQDLPPPPPNFFNSDLDLTSRSNYHKQPPHRDQPLDLSAKTPTEGRPESWAVRRFDEDNLTMPNVPPPEPPIRLGETANSYNRNNTTTSSNTIGSTSNNNTGVDLRSRHESLMMRSAYGLDGQPPSTNYHLPYYHPPHHHMPQQPQRHYYPQQPPYSPHPQQQHPVRQHYRSGSVRSIDYRHDYEEPWDQQNPANFQTAPDGMRHAYNVGAPHHYSSRSSLLSSTSSWAPPYPPDPIDPRIPMEEQFWFHGTISRTMAEGLLRSQREGAYLVRMSESNRLDLSLSVKSSRGFMHMKIVTNQDGRYILGQFSQPFSSIPLMIHHYTLHKLPIKGAEHVSLTTPIANDMM